MPKKLRWLYFAAFSPFSFLKILYRNEDCFRVLCKRVDCAVREDSVAASLFENNWLSWQIVSKHKTQITLLILGRGALSIIFCCVQSLYCHLDTRHHFYPWSLVFKTIAWSRFKVFSCVLKCPIWATFEVLITFKRSHQAPNEVSILAWGR